MSMYERGLISKEIMENNKTDITQIGIYWIIKIILLNFLDFMYKVKGNVTIDRKFSGGVANIIDEYNLL